jgi:ABC-type multidrug transport system ATPase subunit
VILDRGRVLVDGALDDVRKARRGVHLRTVRPLDFSRMPESLSAFMTENSPGDYSVEEAPQSYIAALAVWLSEQGVEVVEMRTGLASLEEVFRKLTGGDGA